MVKNQRGVVVAYKVVPGEPDQSIIVDTSSLMAEEHDSLIKTVEDASGQEADEFATVMARSRLPDGSNMLARFHQTGKMMKVPSDTVEMTPNNNTTINLAELNQVIAEQKGVTVGDLALTDADGNRPRRSAMYYTENNEGKNNTVSFTHMDEPATTSSITYKIQIQCATAGTSYVNRSHRDTNSATNDARLASSITVMEVSG